MESGWSDPPAGPGEGLGVEAFELEEALGAEGIPASALAFEAAVDVHFDVLFHGAGAGFDRGGGAAGAAAEGGGPVFPSVDALAVAEQVAEEGAKFLGASLTPRAGG